MTASLASAAPWLVTLSAHKEWTFALTALCLGYAWWRMQAVTACALADARRLRWQRWLLRVSTALFAISLFAAYALLPISVWVDR